MERPRIGPGRSAGKQTDEASAGMSAMQISLFVQGVTAQHLENGRIGHTYAAVQ
jgi:hypothetical protein